MIERATLGQLAKFCDHHVAKPIGEIARMCREELERKGLGGSALAILEDQERLQRGFQARLVPNPAFWRQERRQRFAFFGVEAPSSEYRDLLDMLHEFPNVSHYVCYGDLDVLVRAAGTKEELQRLDDYLNKGRFAARRYLVEETPIFYGFWTGDVAITPLDVAEEAVDDALEQSAHSVDKTLVGRLMDAGVVLGTVYHEDHRETGRIRAFVGVTLRDEFKPGDRRRFEAALKEINPREIKRYFSEPLISVYRCASPKFSYLIQLICDDQSQLDRLTDEIQDASDAVWDTNTMIVAKNEERPFLYSSSSAEQADAQVAVGLISGQRLLPLVQSVRRAGPDLVSLFDAASVEQQLTAVGLQRDLAEPDGLALPGEFGQFALDLIRAVLRDRASDIKNAGQALVRDCVEPAHNAVASLIVREVFGDNTEYFQSELKMSDKLFWKWGLRVWGHLVYPKWNAHPFLGQLMTVPEGVLWSMGVVGQTRNRFAHVRPSVGNRELIQAAREVFYHAAVVQRWSEEAAAVLVDPAVRWKAVRESMLGPKDRQVTRMLDELVSLREQVFAKLDEQRSEMAPQMQSIANTIVAIRDGQTKLSEETLDDLEARMLQVLDSSRGEQAKSGFSYLRKAAQDLPIGVAASLLASILGGAMALGR